MAIISSSLADMAGSCGGFCVFEPADLEIKALGNFVIFCEGACFPGSFGASGILPFPRKRFIYLLDDIRIHFQFFGRLIFFA